MSKPIVAIVGRPNVGKSTLFNRIAKKRIAIVDSTPGVTRDRNYTEIENNGKPFILLDTGGFEDIDKEDDLSMKMREQTELAIEEADFIIFLLDGKEGITPMDKEIYRLLKKSDKKLLLAVNKIDHEKKHDDRLVDFFSLGKTEIHPVSAEHNIGVESLVENITKLFQNDSEDGEDTNIPRIAVVGKPNTGKSTLINRLLGEERMIVSNIAGTTRDSIDTLIINGEDKYLFIDTAGIRKKGKVDQKLEKYSIIMAIRSIERADVCLLMIDCSEGVTEQDLKIGNYISESGKSCIIVINKWDLAKKSGGDRQEGAAMIKKKMKFLSYAPIVFLSALTGYKVDGLFKTVRQVSEERLKKITTSRLNKLIEESIKMKHPPSFKGKEINIYYGTQVKSSPPTFMLYVNRKEGLGVSYLRYLKNCIRKKYEFIGSPIRLVIKNRDRSTGK